MESIDERRGGGRRAPALMKFLAGRRRAHRVPRRRREPRNRLARLTPSRSDLDRPARSLIPTTRWRGEPAGGRRTRARLATAAPSRLPAANVERPDRLAHFEYATAGPDVAIAIVVRE